MQWLNSVAAGIALHLAAWLQLSWLIKHAKRKQLPWLISIYGADRI